MKLEVNHNHKRIDVSPLQKSLKDFTIGILGVSVAISLYSGILTDIAYADDYERPAVTATQNYDEVSIPEDFRYNIASKVGKSSADIITKEDLSTINMLFLTIDNDDIDLDFLKYCTNLKILFLNIKDNKNILKKISYNNSIENLLISSLVFDTTYITEHNEITPEDLLTINNNLPSLQELALNNVIITPGCETELNKLNCLSLGSIENCDLDFTKLTGIKKLNVKSEDPYDLAIFLNSEEYKTLLDSGVKIEFANEDAKNKYLQALAKLDEIVVSLGVDKDSSDQKKLDTILIYVLENLTYDKEVSAAVQNGDDHQKLAKVFYTDGSLYGALETSSSICGNYAALVEALMDRLNVPKESMIVASRNHAWNLVTIEGEPYYVDATWLDGKSTYIEHEEKIYDENNNLLSVEISWEPIKVEELLKNGQAIDLNWYMENPNAKYIATIDKNDDHIPNFIPSYMTLDNSLFSNTPEITNTEPASIEENISTPINNNIQEQETPLEDISQKKIRIKIGTKEIIITAGALIGVMTGLGVAIKAKKKKERQRRMAQYSPYNYDYYSSKSYDHYGGYRR